MEYKEVEESVKAMLLKLPIIEEASLDYRGASLEFFPAIDKETEVLVVDGRDAYEIGLVDWDEHYDWLELEQRTGNLLNTALDALCEKLELKKPFWSSENEERMERYLRSLEVQADGLYNLYCIIRELLNLSKTKGQWRSKVDQNSFNMLLEDSLPHTKTTKGLIRYRIVSVIRNKPNSEKEEYPVFSLFDIIYLSLRSNAVDNGRVLLKECALCKKLFFANRTDMDYCLLNDPYLTCRTQRNRDKGNAESKKNKRYADATRLIKEQSLSIYENDKARNTDLVVFAKQWSKLGKQLDGLEMDIVEKYNKESDFLDAFIERYDPEKPIEDLIEESKIAVGVGSQKD